MSTSLMQFSALSWMAVAVALVVATMPAFSGRTTADQEEQSPCTEDAMIVLDA
jgi:hypothetical protein